MALGLAGLLVAQARSKAISWLTIREPSEFRAFPVKVDIWKLRPYALWVNMYQCSQLVIREACGCDSTPCTNSLGNSPSGRRRLCWGVSPFSSNGERSGIFHGLRFSSVEGLGLLPVLCL